MIFVAYNKVMETLFMKNRQTGPLAPNALYHETSGR